MPDQSSTNIKKEPEEVKVLQTEKVTANSTGISSATKYCGRQLGVDAIPGSDGRCGPTNGPQCADCKSGRPSQNVQPSQNNIPKKTMAFKEVKPKEKPKEEQK